MIVISTADLNHSRAVTELPLQFIFRGKEYICKKQYSKPNFTAAIAECRKQLDEGLFCILVESASTIGLCFSSIRQGQSQKDRSAIPEAIKTQVSAAKTAASPIAVKLAQKYAAGERNFRRLDLRNQNLADLNLVGANLSHSNLSGSNLRGTNLSGANLSNANLSNAQLVNTDLSKANLTKVNLSGANIKGTKLSGARLRGAIMPDGTS